MHCLRLRIETFWLACGLLALLVAGVTGCSGKLATAQVRGRVAYKDGSIPQGEVCIVRFETAPNSTAAKGRAATGDIGRDGSFDMYTKKPGDGVMPGEYMVTFTVMKSHLEPESLIDEKYTKADTTPYRITVAEDIDGQVFEIEPREPAAEASGKSSKESTEQPTG
jgi:hypothetical protein